MLLADSCHELCKCIFISCVSIEEVLHSVLILLDASLVIRRKVAEVDGLCAVAEHLIRVLSAKDAVSEGLVRCKISQDVFVVDTIGILNSDILHDLVIRCHVEDDILYDVCVVSALCCADPCAAPIEALRSVYKSPAACVSDGTVIFLSGISAHGEVDQPCGSKVAEYIAGCLEALAPVITPPDTLFA